MQRLEVSGAVRPLIVVVRRQRVNRPRIKFTHGSNKTTHTKILFRFKKLTPGHTTRLHLSLISILTVIHRSPVMNTQTPDFLLCNHYDLQTCTSSKQQYINAVHISVAMARTNACMQICRCAHRPSHFHTSCVNHRTAMLRHGEKKKK